MNDTQLLERLNTAPQDDLKTLAGIGAVLAERLISARPFETLDDVAAVKGIKPNLFANWMESSVPLVDPEPAPLLEADAQPEAVFNDAQPEDEAEDEKRKQAPNPRVDHPVPTEKSGIWDKVSGYLLTSIASIILTLAILGGINGGLRFARNVEYQTTANELSQLSDDVVALQEDILGLRNRVDTLDGLTDRTMGIEEKQAELAEELTKITEELAAAQNELDTMNENLTQQDERTLRFEGFLENLHQTLNDFFPQEGGE